MEKEQHSEHMHHSESGNAKEKLKLATSATLHCLLGGMLLAMTAGFIAAFPVNYILVGRGIRHVH